MQPLPNCPGEVITEGLDGLGKRLDEYHELGAKFAKWRAVIDIGAGIPTYACIHTNTHALARYAALCQEHGIVPIVEPEVLMDGDHSIDRCYEVTEFVLKQQFQELYYQRVALEGMVLKPNMAISGKKAAKRAGVEEVAEKTVKLLKACVPGAVPGIAFLSGGQSDEEATAHLDAMNKIGNLPWALTFSYGRALQAAPQKAWSGKSRERRRRATRLLPPRRHELARRQGPVEAGPREEGGVSQRLTPRSPASSPGSNSAATPAVRPPRRRRAGARSGAPATIRGRRRRCPRSAGGTARTPAPVRLRGCPARHR